MTTSPQTPGPNPDLFLARRAAAGHADAWTELIERYGRRIYNIAFQFAGNTAEAEDLTQEIFLKLYRNLGRYRGDVPLAGWTLRLSRNLCVDHYRRTRTERRTVVVSEELLKHQAGGMDTAARAERRERLRMVYQTLEEDAGGVRRDPHAAGSAGLELRRHLRLPRPARGNDEVPPEARASGAHAPDRPTGGDALGDPTPTRSGAYK